MIFWIGLSGISGGFMSRFLKCSFHFKSLSSWQTAFSFAPNMIFLPLTSFTVCHANCGCLFSTELLILLIWPLMYSNFSFSCVLISSFWAFLSFCKLAFVEFLFLSKDAFFKLSPFPYLLVTPMELYIWLEVWLVSTLLIYIYIYICTYTCFIHLHIYMHVCAYIYIYTHTYTQIKIYIIHIYIYIYIYIIISCC